MVTQRPRAAGFPVFAKTMFIIDLALSGLRVPLILLAVVGYAALQQNNDPMLPTVSGEIATGFAMAMFGIAAGVFALLRKPWAVWLGWLAVLATLGSFGVGLWQASLKMAEFAPGSPERIGGYVGFAFVVIFRLGYLGLYAGALVQFARWINRHAAPSPTTF
jgi:hypothetical protein